MKHVLCTLIICLVASFNLQATYCTSDEVVITEKSDEVVILNTGEEVYHLKVFTTDGTLLESTHLEANTTWRYTYPDLQKCVLVINGHNTTSCKIIAPQPKNCANTDQPSAS